LENENMDSLENEDKNEDKNEDENEDETY